MKKISIALATFNEEKNIGACLRAVKDWVDEIIVVDGESTDRTAEIAKKYGAKVIVTTNKPIFHLNKQMAIDSCQSDWILQLDADERVTPKLRQEILAKMDKTKFNGFWLPRKNCFLGRFLTKGGQYPDYTLRLYRRGKGYLPCQTVHEQAVVKGEAGYLKSDLLHYPYPDFFEYLNKAHRYARLFADEYETQKVKTNLWTLIKYLLFIPSKIFFKIYIRHLGFFDGFAGLIFAIYSAIVRITAYVVYWERVKSRKKG